jgi:hypothetical protein
VRLLIGSRADVQGLPTAASLAPPPIERPIGPVSPPRAADGRLYDTQAFLLSDPALQPRSGPTHPQHQLQIGSTLYIIKFGDVVPSGRAYELYRVEAEGLRHLEDASGSTPMHFTDTRWWPRHMPIGEAHAFRSGPHEEVWCVRDPCRVDHRDPVNRKMWLHAVYDDWYWGPDLGHRPTIMLVYDDTDQAELPGRYVEVGYYAAGAGWVRWEAYHAEQVYPNGPQHGAVFPPAAMSSRSDFYLVGGPVMTPQLTGCVSPDGPFEKPWDSPPQPVPTPDPVPTPTPLPPAQPVGGSMRAYVKTAQFYTGINPTAQTKDLHGHPLTGDGEFPIYFNRPGQKNEGGGWETVELTPHDGGQFDVRYVDSNRQLSVDQFGAMTSRAAGAIGSDELFYATTQPDGSNLLYRFQNGVLVSTVLTLEAKQ